MGLSPAFSRCETMTLTGEIIENPGDVKGFFALSKTYTKTAVKGDYDKFMDEISRNKVADNRSTNKRGCPKSHSSVHFLTECR